METGILIIMLFSLLVTAVVTIALPQLSRPTVPLGVSVPSDRVDHPVVVAAIKRYRIWTLLGAIITAAIMVATANMPEKGALFLLAYVTFSLVVYAVCRRTIMQAKAAEGWYDDVQVQIAAPVTKTQTATPLWPLLLFAVGICLAAIAVMALNFSSLPDPLPVHYDAAGNVTDWQERTWVNVLAMPLIALLTTLVLTGICAILARRHDAHFPDGNPQAAQRFQRGNMLAVQRVLAIVTLLSAMVMSALAVAPLFKLNANAMAWISFSVVAATLLPIVYLVFDSVRRHRALRATPPESGPQSPDDDRLWVWGMFYLNHDDPRMWVPKRNGLGLTVNLGHPGGAVFMSVIALILLASIALLISL